MYFMSNNILKLDSAMNMIKEELLKELSESVMNRSKNRSNMFNNVSFSDENKD